MTLTPEQELLKNVALRSGEDVPFITNDPKVNHAVDCHQEDRAIPFDQKLYDDEIRAWKITGGLMLGWIK